MQIMKQLSIKGLFLPAIALCSLLLSGNAAHAALVTYSFTGTMTDMSSAALTPTLSLVSPNNIMSGTFQFDNTTPASGPGIYSGAVKNLSLTIGSYSVNVPTMTTGLNGILISNNSPGDLWRLQTAVAGGGLINGFTPYQFDLNVVDGSGTTLSSTALQNPPSLGDLLSSPRWRVLFENGPGGDIVSVRGAISSLTAVPLPAAVLLFGAGLISLVGLVAGGLRNLRWPQA